MRIGDRYELAMELMGRYAGAGRAERGAILDAFCLATGYHRKYAIAMLRGRRRVLVHKMACMRNLPSSGAMIVAPDQVQEREEVPMAIVGGLDVHRSQITFDYVNAETGEIRRGQVPGTRLAFRGWLARIPGRPAAFAVEGCTGWRFVVEELRRAGMEAHLAEPADTQALRGPKRHAKTDGIDARHLRQLLAARALPESWIPPEHVQEMRTRVRLYKDLVDEHITWQQRIHATLFHQGVHVDGDVLAPAMRRRLMDGEGLSPAGREAVSVALRRIDSINNELEPIRRAFASFTRRQPGCRALTEEYGIGAITAVAIWAELGDCRRFSSSRDAVRHTPGSTSPCTPRTASVPLATSPTKDHRCCAGPSTRQPSAVLAAPLPTTPTTPASSSGKVRIARRSRWPASWCAAPITACAAWATRHSRRRDDHPVRSRPLLRWRVTTWPAPGEPVPPGPRSGRPHKNERPHPLARGYPITHHVAGSWSVHRDKAGHLRAPGSSCPTWSVVGPRQPQA
jgi:transposase